MADVPNSHVPLEVLYEDNHLLVVNKPANLVTMGVGPDRTSLLDVAKEYIRNKYHKPGNVYLGIVSRLDAPVTGIVVIARTSKAAGRLAAAFRQREVEKVYWAAVDGQIEPATAHLEHYLRKDERHRRVHTTHTPTVPARKPPGLITRVSVGNAQCSLVEVRPGSRPQTSDSRAACGPWLPDPRRSEIWQPNLRFLKGSHCTHADWRWHTRSGMRECTLKPPCPPPGKSSNRSDSCSDAAKDLPPLVEQHCGSVTRVLLNIRS